ncbi:hypothetical protein F5148DRAFT_1367256 [Russula earlei]|uniref:Uncharacterized protein n=1 Tax=Russula earlei TaxID=71964 RepID=A0ACC0UC49_9AGAM|nr:hypothetical protein F5148DRAFT_1367256 [Russula earlei]
MTAPHPLTAILWAMSGSIPVTGQPRTGLSLRATFTRYIPGQTRRATPPIHNVALDLTAARHAVTLTGPVTFHMLTYPECTYSGSSAGIKHRKVGIEAEPSARPSPNEFTQSPSRELDLTGPNRRVPFTLPSHLAMAQPVPGFPDLHTPITSSPTNSDVNTFSSSFCAATIAARAAAADSSPPPSLTKSPPLAPLLQPSPLPSSPSSCRQRSKTIHTSDVQSSDASSLQVLLDGLDAPLPPVERRTQHPASLTPGPPSRPAGPHLSASFPLPAKFSIEGVSARLSPAIITRQPQHPILSLPPISPASTPANISSRLRSQSLRSVPALPKEGSEAVEPAEHDNAVLDEFDEEEDGVGDGGEDAEEEATEVEHPESASDDGESVSDPSSSETSRLGNLPAIDTSRLHFSFIDINTSDVIRRDDKTPKDHRMSDYFTSKLSEPASRTPLLNSRQLPSTWASAWATPVLPTSTPSPNVLAAASATSASRALPTPTTPLMNVRTSIYHQASRSMIDISEMLRRQLRTPEVAAKTPKSPLHDPSQEADTEAVGSEEPDTLLEPSLRRRLSMPTFGPSSAPPPYPEFRFGMHGPTVQPRDEEGCERLPQYTNGIYLRAIMPRKMEFSAPGVQARDRKWRRTLCVLEGTAFRVYKCRPTDSGKGLIGNLWEKTVGVGDIAISSTQTSDATKENERERERERERRRVKLDGADGVRSPSPMSSPTSTPTSPSSQTPSEPGFPPSPSSTRPRLLPSNFRRKNRVSSGGLSVSRNEFDTSSSFSALRPVATNSGSNSGPSSSPTTSTSARRRNQTTPSSVEAAMFMFDSPSRTFRTPRAKRRHLWVDDPAVPQPQEQDLLHAYALHNSESGLGSDYVKRRNVIRVRMEGEQFLLQARDVASVVDWIEGFQAAANISQDLDDRPMPKGPLFPRKFAFHAYVPSFPPIHVNATCSGVTRTTWSVPAELESSDSRPRIHAVAIPGVWSCQHRPAGRAVLRAIRTTIGRVERCGGRLDRVRATRRIMMAGAAARRAHGVYGLLNSISPPRGGRGGKKEKETGGVDDRQSGSTGD